MSDGGYPEGSGEVANFKARPWSLVLPLVAAAAAVAGVLAYHFFLASPSDDGFIDSAGWKAEVRSSSGGSKSASGAFSFNAYERPRVLPEVPFTNGNGEEMGLADFKGKTILLNLWATWCVPCREEMPTLDRLQAKLGGPDFEVVALSIDQDGALVVEDFYEELGLENLGIYVDDSMRAPALLSVIGIPATLLIDREGREIGRKLGPAEWDSEEVIGEIRRYQ